MKQNMNLGSRIASTSNQANNAIIEKYCYNDSDAICVTDGGLYQWDEAMQYSTAQGAQGICLVGWHIPSDLEICTLEKFLDNTITCSSEGFRGNAGAQLRIGGTSGFDALINGFYHTDAAGHFLDRGLYGYFWSTTQLDALWAVQR
jgi:uncharacterized protein (TIGR02145 family)